MSAFTFYVDQNEFLPPDGTEVNAIVTVVCEGVPAATATPPDAAEIVIIDTSGSMGVPNDKIDAALEATSVAIDCIPDGVAFAVIAGTECARQVYPVSGGLAAMSDITRSRAKHRVASLRADGGTAIGTWLTLAKELFETSPAARCHAIVLTDGDNRDETPEDLRRAITSCEGAFQCDCRGVGADWVVEGLRWISTALLGAVDFIAEPQGMAADFRELIERAMSEETSTVVLRLWTPKGATVGVVRQVAPTIVELTGCGVSTDPQTEEYPTGTWRREARDYHVQVDVVSHAIGDEILAGRIRLVVDGGVAAEAQIRAIWTDDERRLGGPDDLAGQGVREPRRPTPPRDSGAIQLPRPDDAA